MVWGGFFKIRILSIFRMHAAGDFIVVYHIWFIMYDIVLWVRVGFLHKDDRHLCWYGFSAYMLALMCQTKNLQYTCIEELLLRNRHTLIITWEYQTFGVDWKIDIGCIIGHGRSTHVGIREGENGHGGLERGKELFEWRWKGKPDT